MAMSRVPFPGEGFGPATRRFLLLVAPLALLACAEVDPVPWEPPDPPDFAGPHAVNTQLRAALKITIADGIGPEDVDVDAEGRLYAGVQDGRILRIIHPGMANARVETFARTGGRPLGLAFDSGGRLLVADAERGLLRIDVTGRVTVLMRDFKGVPLRFTDDVDVAPDGRIYFSDASMRHGMDAWKKDIVEARPTGRLFRYDPASGEAEVLLDGLAFANGVAVSPGGDFVLVNETGRYRVHRVWITGPLAGQSEVFVDNLPGFPDGISRAPEGYWLALASPRNSALDFMHPHPWLKRIAMSLPASMQPKAIPHGLVLHLDAAGRIGRALHDPGGQVVAEVTSVQQVGAWLYLGGLHATKVARLQP